MTKKEDQIIKDLEEARNLYLDNNYTKAIQIYNKLASLLKNDTVNYRIIQIELGWSYYNNQDYHKAIEQLQNALGKGALTAQQQFDCNRIIGFSYEMLGDFKKAIEFLEIAISLNIPRKIKRFASFELGKILFVKGSIIEAETQFRIAESLFEKKESEYLATLNYYLGFIEYFQKRHLIAKKRFEYVIQNAEDFKTRASGYFGLAHIHYYQKDFEILIDI